MRLVIQRVTRGSVTNHGEMVGSIGAGLVVLVGLSRTDHEADLDYLCKKLLHLRLFDDAQGEAWAQGCMAAQKDVLLVSQFTLYGVPKGNKPDFHNARTTDEAAVLYALFVKKVQAAYKGGKVESGVFGGSMQVELVNDGPTTMMLDTDDLDLSKEREKLDKAKAKYGVGRNNAVANAAAAAGSASPAASPVASASPASDAPAATAVQSAAPTATAAAAASTPSANPTSVAAGSTKCEKADSSATKEQTVPAGSAPAASAGTSAAPSAASSLPSLPDLSFSSLVGNTSLILLRRISEATGCQIYGKAEYENPGASIKDRAAVSILDAAEAAGELVRGQPGWIVEGTAGNTGLGLALAGAARGYRTLVVLADNNSAEKQAALRAVGATLLLVPQVPFLNSNNYVHVARRVYEAMKEQQGALSPPVRVLLADQWSNAANRAAHMRGTGPEIWRQTQGKVDAFCCGVGTGGTLSGVSLFLKNKRPGVKSVLIDPEGSALKDFFERGELASAGSSIAEGIGQGRLCDNLVRDSFAPDFCLRVTDREALPLSYELLEHEGISVGSSSAINVAGAYKLAQQMGPGHVIVTVLCDAGMRYASKMANPEFLRSKDLPVPRWLDETDPETAARQRMAAQMLQLAVLPTEESQQQQQQQQQQQAPAPVPAAATAVAGAEAK